MPHDVPEATLQRKPQAVYRIQEFAKLAGVTVRALRHYDRLGLLTPVARSGAGYRLYRDFDLARIEQITVLKFIGFPLTRIRQLVQRESNLKDALQSQQQVLSHTRDRISAAIDAIGEAERSFAFGGEPDWRLLAAFVREEMKTHQLEDARQTIHERRQIWKPTLRDYELARDVRAVIDRHEPPTSPASRATVARWKDAIDRFTGGDPAIRTALGRVMADQAHWPGPAMGSQVREFFERAMRA